MRIQHNIMAMNAYRNYTNNTSALSGNLEKLSSGYKINRAGDDAAGLAISEKMRAQIAGLSQAQDNAQSGINLVQTAEGALQEVHDMLNRMVTLADQSANGTFDNETDRANLQQEIEQLKTEIDRIADSANYNGINLLDGSLGGASGAGNGSISTVEVMGGNLQAAVDLTAGGLTFAFTMTSGVAGSATLTMTSGPASAAGVTWELVGAGGSTATVTGDYGGAFTFKANVANVTDDNIRSVYEGMTVTVTVNALDRTTGEYAAGSFNGAVTLADGLTLQIGDTSDSFNQMKVNLDDMHSDSLGIDSINVGSQQDAKAAVNVIREAINKVSSTRGLLGATQNRLDHTINNLSVMTENIQDAESTIRDTDVAEEMMDYVKNNILVQSAQAMLAQANQVPQGVLQLLQ